MATTYTVTAPNAAYSGTQQGVTFSQGRAEKVPEPQARALAAVGFEIAPTAAAKPAKKGAAAASAPDADQTPDA